jgi:hypothetical protein
MGMGLNVRARAIRSFAESQGYTLIDIVPDPGVSGAKWPEDGPAVVNECRPQRDARRANPSNTALIGLSLTAGSLARVGK